MLLKLAVYSTIAFAFLALLGDMSGINRSMSDKERRSALSANLEAMNMAQYHSFSLAFFRDNALHLGVIPEDATGLEPYTSTTGYSSIGNWQSAISLSGCVFTYSTDLGTSASNARLGAKLFSLTENPTSGVTTDTGIVNSRFEFTLSTGLGADRAIIASCDG